MPRREFDCPGRGRSQRVWRRGRGLTTIAALVAGLGACDGQGLYDTPTGPGPGPGPVQPSTGRGELVNIPGVGIIADMVVDPASGNVFLSNQGQHRLEVLNLDGLQFRASVPVGSQPWGLAMNWNRAANATGDTLIVANSGGTNVSFVHTSTLQEDVGRRFDIPRITLYEIDVAVEDNDTVYNDIRFYNYADRPQYVVQDSRGRLVYSAISTEAAPIGSVRVAEWRDNPAQPWREWDARFLFHERSLERADGIFAVANTDSVILTAVNRAVVYDHVPGSVPRQALASPPLPIEAAVEWLRARGSDAELYVNAQWRVPQSVALADTTYVAASGDRRWVLIGEGARDAASRIIMWTAEGGRSSLVEDIADIVNNTSDFLYGVELNHNGSLGVARGAQATYFFGNDLRLQGLATAPEASGRGAGFLPNSTTNRTYAFEPTGNGRVRVLETTHYAPLGEIPVREAIAGPFRVGPPRPGVAAACPDLQGDPTCVVATVYGVTAGRRLLVLDVQRQDIIQ